MWHPEIDETPLRAPLWLSYPDPPGEDPSPELRSPRRRTRKALEGGGLE